jgi:hypothetical protein
MNPDLAGRIVAGPGLAARDRGPHFSNPLPPPPCPQFFGCLVNSSSLAPAHARPAQISPKNFKHP